MGYDRHVVSYSVARLTCAKYRRYTKNQIEDKEKTVPVMESEGLSCRAYETDSQSGKHAVLPTTNYYLYCLFSIGIVETVEGPIETEAGDIDELVPLYL